jgi:dCTP deaminase
MTANGVVAAVNPASPDFNYAKIAEKHTEILSIPAGGFDLKSGEFVLAWTVEKIKLPHRSRIAARVEGKSSLARLGIGIHVTAPTIHAGFGYDPDEPKKDGNPIQLEIWNIGCLTIRLTRGMKICQLILEEVHGTPEKGYSGMFMTQGRRNKRST